MRIFFISIEEDVFYDDEFRLYINIGLFQVNINIKTHFRIT